MSVKVTCHYFIDACTFGLSCKEVCDYDYEYSEYCKDYLPADKRIGAACAYYKAQEAVIHRTFRAVEYEEGDGLSIGKEFIPYDNIEYLALDFGDGERIFINRKETTDNE